MPAARPHQQIELADIGSIYPHPDNPRQGDIGAISESIAVNGWWGAVIVSRRADGTGIILAGEHRWRALAALQNDGYTRPDGETVPYDQLNSVPPAGKVPIIPLESLTLAQEQKVLLADNRANDLAAYDDARLAELLVGLAESDGLLGTLFDGDALDLLLADLDTEVHLPGTQQLSRDERADVWTNSAIRQIVVVLNAEDFPEANAILDRARDHFQADTNSDAALAVWRAWAADHAAPDQDA